MNKGRVVMKLLPSLLNHEAQRNMDLLFTSPFLSLLFQTTLLALDTFTTTFVSLQEVTPALQIRSSGFIVGVGSTRSCYVVVASGLVRIVKEIASNHNVTTSSTPNPDDQATTSYLKGWGNFLQRYKRSRERIKRKQRRLKKKAQEGGSAK